MMALVWLVLSALAFVYAMVAALAVVRTMLAVPRVPPLDEPLDRLASSLPKLSVIVPACNEAASIEEALRSKLASTYPALEIVVVDDRSTDDTGAIVDRMALDDPRLRVVHLRELPEGWDGKLHALERGAREATGELLLFSDADVRFSSDILVRTARVMEREGLDFVTMLPDVTRVSPALDAALSALLRLLVSGARVWKVRDPRSRVGVGAGLFNLVRRSAYERSPGFAWLRMEVADDVVFGQMMKQSGARSAVFQGRGDVMLSFYSSLGELVRGLEKNAYALSGFRPALMAMVLAVLGVFELLPPIEAILVHGWTRAFALGSLALLTAAQCVLARWLGRPLATSLVPCFGALVLFVVSVRAVILVHARAGIVWRGTFYSLEALRAGARFER
jgi:glycosyltransferase involved in cell wall biosynthesis